MGDRAIELTPRESEMVGLMVQGHSSRRIAEMMGLSKHTISTYQKRVFQKRSVHSRAELTAQVLGVSR